MAGTYAALALILAGSAAAGQGLFAACGRREWTWLSPAVGLGVLIAVAWGALNVTGEPAAGLAAAVITAAAGLALSVAVGTRLDPPGAGVAVLLLAIALASLPFAVEGRFGILGISLNPDMSQHLFAADRLASGGEERLITEGYPLGPHALVVSVAELGPSLVAGFSGLTLAIAAAASLAALQLLGGLAVGRRIAAALLVGLAYMTASYLIQGAFKETMQALFVLAFAIGLHELALGTLGGRDAASRWRLLRAVPLAALAAGSVYAYSFPGLAWPVGALGLWALAEAIARRGVPPLRPLLGPVGVACAVALVAMAPEAGRMADFKSFETFDPDGAGLGNLFNPVSPLEALGIWPSGDFRLDPGAGAAPAVAFWLGGLLGLAALAFGLGWWLRRRELALPAALAAATLLYLYALLGGTPYQEAKAIAIAAPLAMLIAVRALLLAAPAGERHRTSPEAKEDAARRGWGVAALAATFALAAAGSSALALVNGPVGPDDWSPDLIELRQSGDLGPGGEDGDDTLVLAPREVLVDQHGEDLFLWELRGGRVCADLPGGRYPDAIEHVLAIDDRGKLFPPGSFAAARRSEPGFECPYIADGDRADPGD